MKLTEVTKMRLKLRELEKKNSHYREVLPGILKLVYMVAPAIVYNVDEIGENRHPSLSKFAASHGYDVGRFLKLLRAEGILTKERGTWLLTRQYRKMGLVFYTIGRTNIYSSLDMFLLPEGEKFMERFIAAHPVQRREKRDG